MTKEEVLKHAINAGFIEGHYYDYSGRGMYGETTPAVITDEILLSTNLGILNAIADLGDQKVNEMSHRDFLRYAKPFLLRRSDSMGLSFIYY